MDIFWCAYGSVARVGQVRGGVLPKSEFYANYGVLYDVVLISIYYI